MTEHTRMDYRNVVDLRAQGGWLTIQNGPPAPDQRCYIRLDAITSWEAAGSHVRVFCDRTLYVFGEQPAHNMGGDYEAYPLLRRLETVLVGEVMGRG